MLLSLTYVLTLCYFLCAQVGEITKIMRAYINMMVKKRCSIMSVTSVTSSWVRWSPQTSQSPQFISLATDASASPSPALVGRFKRSQSYQKANPCGWTKKKGGKQGGKRKKWVQRPNTAPTTGLGFTFDKRNEHGWKKSIFWESSTKHINPSPGLVLHVDVQAHSRLLCFSSRTKLSHDKAQLSRPVPDNSATSPVHCQTEERHTFSASSCFLSFSLLAFSDSLSFSSRAPRPTPLPSPVASFHLY